jgi:P2 family phage contractile tail tube protein
MALLTNVFNLFDVDTNKKLTGTVSLELPATELATETYKGAGVSGEINVPVPGVMSAQTATLSFSHIYGDNVKYMKLGSTQTLDLRSEVIRQNAETLIQERVPYRWVLKGPLSSAKAGKIESGAAGDASVEMQVYYMHNWIDGEEKLEWDVFKYVYKVDGEDLMAETRKNILA